MEKDSCNPTCLIDRIILKNRETHNNQFDQNWMLGNQQGLS